MIASFLFPGYTVLCYALKKGKATIMAQITFLVGPTSTKVMQIIAEAYKSQEWHEKFCCSLSEYEIASTTPPLTVWIISCTLPITKPVPQTAQKLFPAKNFWKSIYLLLLYRLEEEGYQCRAWYTGCSTGQEPLDATDVASSTTGELWQHGHPGNWKERDIFSKKRIGQYVCNELGVNNLPFDNPKQLQLILQCFYLPSPVSLPHSESF